MKKKLPPFGDASRDKELAYWWSNHKKQDQYRIAAEKRAQRLAEKKRAALAKLSKEEKKILGL